MSKTKEVEEKAQAVGDAERENIRLTEELTTLQSSSAESYDKAMTEVRALKTVNEMKEGEIVAFTAQVLSFEQKLKATQAAVEEKSLSFKEAQRKALELKLETTKLSIELQGKCTEVETFRLQLSELLTKYAQTNVTIGQIKADLEVTSQAAIQSERNLLDAQLQNTELTDEVNDKTRQLETLTRKKRVSSMGMDDIYLHDDTLVDIEIEDVYASHEGSMNLTTLNADMTTERLLVSSSEALKEKLLEVESKYESSRLQVHELTNLLQTKMKDYDLKTSILRSSEQEVDMLRTALSSKAKALDEIEFKYLVSVSKAKENDELLSQNEIIRASLSMEISARDELDSATAVSLNSVDDMSRIIIADDNLAQLSDALDAYDRKSAEVVDAIALIGKISEDLDFSTRETEAARVRADELQREHEVKSVQTETLNRELNELRIQCTRQSEELAAARAMGVTMNFAASSLPASTLGGLSLPVYVPPAKPVESGRDSIANNPVRAGLEMKASIADMSTSTSIASTSNASTSIASTRVKGGYVWSPISSPTSKQQVLLSVANSPLSPGLSDIERDDGSEKENKIRTPQAFFKKLSKKSNSFFSSFDSSSGSASSDSRGGKGRNR